MTISNAHSSRWSKPIRFGATVVVAGATMVAGTAIPASAADPGVLFVENSLDDYLAPEVPQNVRVLEGSVGDLKLSWDASSDVGSGVGSYLIYVDGTYVKWVTGFTTSTSVLGSSTSSVEIRAVDRANNRSPKSEPVRAATQERIAPSVPTNVIVDELGDGVGNISWDESFDNDSGVRNYLVYVDGAYRAWTINTSINLAGIESGSQVQVRAVDRAGNRSDRSLPRAASSTSSADVTAPTTPLNVTATVVPANGGSISLNWDASTDDESGIQSYLIYVDGGYTAWSRGPAINLGAIDASSMIEVRAVDRAGNRSARSVAVGISDSSIAVVQQPPVA